MKLSSVKDWFENRVKDFSQNVSKFFKRDSDSDSEDGDIFNRKQSTPFARETHDVPSTSWGDWSKINKNRKASSDPELASHLAQSFQKLSLDFVKFDRKSEVVSTPLGTDNSRGLEHMHMPKPDAHIEATSHASGSLVSTKPKRFISRLDHRIGGQVRVYTIQALTRLIAMCGVKL